MSLTEIPNINDGELTKEPGKPGWLRISHSARSRFVGDMQKARYERPIIRCNCGELMGIGAHHVHADGCVTASFYDRDGCGWHVFLKLLDYNCGEFPPEQPIRQAETKGGNDSEPK